jgi:GTP 3',8-cyclase
MATTAQLQDTFGRQIRYVRLSVTDRCDFRCVYCMAEDMQFLPRHAVLSIEEIEQLATAFVRLGVDKIRLTGGEPLIRTGIVDLVHRLKRLEGLQQLVLTTNGSRLKQFAQPLKDAGLDRINISLDTLDPTRFRRMTRTGQLQDVLDGIAAVQQAGFVGTKLNCVLLKEYNVEDAHALLEFARQQQLDLTFIEEMPLGQIDAHQRASSQMSSAEVLALLRQRVQLDAVHEVSGGPARYFRMPDSPIRVGLISPNSHNFCGDCNRVRVTATGRLLLCLGHDVGVDLLPILRGAPDPLITLQQHIQHAMSLKPERHFFNPDEPPQIVRFMNMTGG